MGKKRARRSSVSRLPSKRVKKDKSNGLMDLPFELIDSIVSQLIDVPNQHHHAQGATLSIADAFMAPIAQTSRVLRQRCFNLIWTGCLWVKFKINSRQAIETFAIEVHSLPLLPPLLSSQLPPTTSFFELDVGERKDKQRSARQTRQFNDTMNTFLFPYNYDSFNRICSYVADLANSWQLGSVVVRYNPQTKISSDILRDFIIPSIVPIRNLDSVEFELPESDKPSALSVGKMIDETFRASDLLRSARDAIELANKYEAEGKPAEAGLKLLYSYWIVWEAEMFLPTARDWQHGEREDDPDIDDVNYWSPPPARNVIGNQLRASIHEIEYRACLAYVKLYETRGIGWVLTHKSTFIADRGRWIIEPPFTWCGLSTSELAQTHHARALARRVQGELDGFVDALQRNILMGTKKIKKTRKKNTKTEKTLYNPENNDPAAGDMYLARWLDPENIEYHQLWKEVRPKANEDVRAFRTRMKNRKLTQFGWRMDAAMLDRWGGPHVLQYLQFALKRLEDGAAH